MVTRFNIEKLQRLVKRGPGVENHPGAKYIIRDDGTVKDLEFLESVNDVTLKVCSGRIVLCREPGFTPSQEGYIVERHLMDDDVVLFNRQPSLHKMSIMCHKVGFHASQPAAQFLTTLDYFPCATGKDS